MVEVKENELRVDEAIIRYATDEEMKTLREITKDINLRKNLHKITIGEEYMID